MELSSTNLSVQFRPLKPPVSINPNPNVVLKPPVSINPNPNVVHLYTRRRTDAQIRRLRSISAVDGAGDFVFPEITWQVAVGALAGVVPFVVAGIEFGKRIVAQKKCDICGGSGLVKNEERYTRCPGCGGFLPWQSWKRFFTG